MEKYTRVSQAVSSLVTQRYSTSFRLGISRLTKTLRPHIYAIYGFVRLADEIVDSFHSIDQRRFLDEFERQAWDSLEDGFSLNPILHSFQGTVRAYGIDHDLIRAFLGSMRSDLDKKTYASPEEYSEYIYGSADVVGLMCLHVFCEADKELYGQLREPAMRLGSAFQKVNFLRDLATDSQGLGRVYFPNLDLDTFDNTIKLTLVAEIERDFKEALAGIAKLPPGCRDGVFLAYRYYQALLKEIQRTDAKKLLTQRIRVPNWKKALLYPVRF